MKKWNTQTKNKIEKYVQCISKWNLGKVLWTELLFNPWILETWPKMEKSRVNNMHIYIYRSITFGWLIIRQKLTWYVVFTKTVNYLTNKSNLIFHVYTSITKLLCIINILSTKSINIPYLQTVMIRYWWLSLKC